MKFQHAPGLPGYGTVGVDGSDGLLGISTYFCEYDATTTVQVTPKIAGDYKLQEGADVPLADGRIYQTGDMFIDTNGKAYEIDLSLTDLYVYSNSRLNTSTIFVDAGVTTDDPPAYERYANAHWPDKFLIDTVYTNAALANYTLSPGSGGDSIYSTTAKDFARINYVDVSLNNYYPYELFGNTVSNEPEKAIALVKEYGRNTWRLGNLDNTGGVRDVSLYLDFADIYTDGSIHANIEGTANIAETIIIASDNTSAQFYPTFVSTTSGALPVKVNTNLQFNPNTGVLTSTSFTGAGTGLTGIAVDLSVGTATHATSATSATSATNATNAAGLSVTLGVGSGGTGLSTIYAGAILRGGGGAAVCNASSSTTSDGTTLTTPIIKVGNGTVTIPSIRFTTESDTGFYRQGTDAIGVTCNNSLEFLFQPSGDFHADGNVIAYSSTISDIRLKENIKPLESSLDKIIALKGIEYDRKRNGDHHIGLIAQEVEKIIPEVIYETELLGEDGIYKTINYTEIIPYLVESIKELKKEIEILKSK